MCMQENWIYSAYFNFKIQVDKYISSNFSWEQGRDKNINGDKRTITSPKKLSSTKLKDNFACAETYMI